MIVRAIAGRVIREIVRDRRTLAFFLFVPVIIMTLVYVAVSAEDEARLVVLSRGPARLFAHDMRAALEDTDELVLVSLDIPDDEREHDRLVEHIHAALAANEVDGVLYLAERMLAERVAGELYLCFGSGRGKQQREGRE